MNTDNLVSHWTDKSEWDGGRRLWAIYVTLSDQDSFMALARRYQNLLVDLPELDLVRPENLHMTIQAVAFVDEIDSTDLDLIRVDLKELTTAFPVVQLTAGRAAPDYDAIAIPFSPIAPLAALKGQVRDLVARHVEPGKWYSLPQSSSGFVPHATLAYANAPLAVETFLGRLSQVDADLTLTIEEISLVRLGRVDRTWSWDREERFRLAREADER